MSTAPTQADEAELAVEPGTAPTAIKGRSPWQLVRARLLRDKITMAALVASLLFIVLAVLAPLLLKLGVLDLSSHLELVPELGALPSGQWGGITGEHPLGVQPGTGVDLLSLILSGMTTSLEVAFSATAVSIVLGTIMGLIAGFAGGKVDWFISRIIDLVLSFPQTLMLLSLQTVLVALIAKMINLPDTDSTPKLLFMISVL